MDLDCLLKGCPEPLFLLLAVGATCLPFVVSGLAFGLVCRVLRVLVQVVAQLLLGLWMGLRQAPRLLWTGGTVYLAIVAAYHAHSWLALIESLMLTALCLALLTYPRWRPSPPEESGW